MDRPVQGVGGDLRAVCMREVESGVAASNVLQFPRNHDVEEGRDVDRINQFSFYSLGKIFGDLFRGKGDVQRADIFMELYTARGSIKRLLKGDPVQLGLSKGPASDLETALDSVFNDFFQEDDESGGRTIRFPETNDDPIPQWRWTGVTSSMERFETVFREEMREAATYFVPRKGIYSTPALVDTADETFPEDVRTHIPKKSIDDWRAAGRCLAFNLLSATGFHVARAVEGMLEAYYQHFSGKAGRTLSGWGEYVGELEKLASKKDGPDAKTLAEIRQMKDDYRNPIVHHRVILSESDARMLFSNGESLIIGMAQEVKATKDAGQASLALVEKDEEKAG